MIAVIRGPYYTGALTSSGAGTAGGGPTATAAPDELVFGHPHHHRRQVEHLAPLHTHLGCTHQVGSAAGARAGLVPQPLVRVIDQRQRRPRLPSRPLSAPTPQRLRSRLDKRRVRCWRRRRVPVVLPLPLQIGNLGLQRLHHRPQIRHKPPNRHVLRSKLLIRRTPMSRHHNMIDKSSGKIHSPRCQVPDQLRLAQIIPVTALCVRLYDQG